MQAADEDEIVFREEGSEGTRLRVLRGVIVSEDSDFICIQRRDGDWQIRKSLVERVRRAPGRRSP
jgi:hypothetical protein